MLRVILYLLITYELIYEKKKDYNKAFEENLFRLNGHISEALLSKVS